MLVSGALSLLLSLPLGAGEPVIARALALVGTPYRFGGTSEKGFDCAGFVQYSYESTGVAIPRTSREQYDGGEPVLESDLRPGDLVFFRNTYRRGISHVGMYLGDGYFIHAASSRRQVVVDSLEKSYYRKRYAGARRYVP